MRNYINFLLSKTGEKLFTKKKSSFDFECKDPNCPHCLEDIAQMQDDDISPQTEISDEEIESLARNHILYNDSKRQWVIEGMKLYREQLKTK